MKDNPIETKKNILESAKKEFLEKGFNLASLRTIAANANLTTGAMYRHFENKDALFCALVDDAIAETETVLKKVGIDTHSIFANPLGDEHHQEEIKIYKKFLNYIYANFDSFVLLLSRSAGSTHENFLSEMSDLYTSNCAKLLKWMYENKYIKQEVDDILVHFLCNGIIQVFSELVLHNIPQEQAEKIVDAYISFYYAGLKQVLGSK